jgi:hypothetical protein
LICASNTPTRSSNSFWRGITKSGSWHCPS